MSNQCPNAEVWCELGCGQVFPRLERQKHSLECGKQSVVCDFCKIWITKDELTAHQQSICQEYTVTCDYCRMKQLRRGDVSVYNCTYKICTYKITPYTVHVKNNTIIIIITLIMFSTL